MTLGIRVIRQGHLDGRYGIISILRFEYTQP